MSEPQVDMDSSQVTGLTVKSNSVIALIVLSALYGCSLLIPKSRAAADPGEVISFVLSLILACSVTCLCAVMRNRMRLLLLLVVYALLALGINFRIASPSVVIGFIPVAIGSLLFVVFVWASC